MQKKKKKEKTTFFILFFQSDLPIINIHFVLSLARSKR